MQGNQKVIELIIKNMFKENPILIWKYVLKDN